MAEDGQPDRTIYGLALLYLALSQSTDGSLEQTEVDAMTARIKHWKPDATDVEVGTVLSRAMEVYRTTANLEQRRRAIACATIVKRDLDPSQWPRVVTDLRAISEADGIVSDGEDEVVRAVLSVFGYEQE